MKDIVLKGTSVRKELRILLIVFLIAFGLNIYSIITYKTLWGELLTSLGFVAILAIIFYLIVGVIRLLVLGVRKLI
ncbi:MULTISPECIES: hypothetical protein [unclassified Saccharicrinis]|uniref:hypothetical protein n=1 Tax=unclassified Saccharicrinis TaxID=2646859 RepID=UPI003D32C055